MFSQADAAEIAKTFPGDHFKRLEDYAGEKDFQYEARALLGMGEQSISRPRYLSRAWQQLAADFLSPEYRAAMSALTGYDLGTVPIEVNVFHYPPGGELGAHTDLRDKIVTHVLYFNESWDDEDGGCLTILRSSNPRDLVRVVSPLVGNSAVIVRSNNSWHAVSPVVKTCRLS
ncbi:MAG: 2OG-Fe(II) oxygenase, partial [Thermoanaerobaculia bacterium]